MKDRTIDRHRKPRRREKWHNRKKEKANGTYISLARVKWENDHKPVCGGSLDALEQQLNQIK